MYFWTYRLRKTWLDKCLKSPILEKPSRSSMVKGRKHCWNLNDSIFIIFIDSSARNSGWKCLSEWYYKIYDCLLTHWLSITSILFFIEKIYSNIFWWNYLTNEKYFLIYQDLLISERSIQSDKSLLEI